MVKTWELKKCKDTEEEFSAADLQIHPLVGRMLLARGCLGEEVRSFLSPAFSDMLDPALLLGMEAAVSRLLQARRNQETVYIYGDYDVDGITGTALLVAFLRSTGYICEYFIPNRFDDGYGLNRTSLEAIIAQGATLIISVDCGITAVDEATFCSQQGIDLIVVDHHTPKDVIPDVCAVLNPLQPGCSYPFKSLAGVGVAFNLLIALRAALRGIGAFEGTTVPDLREWLDLVALGTIADVVPLLSQNRIYVYHGLLRISRSARPGIQALKRVAGVKEGNVSCGQVGYRLAPRLNAAGRMESAVPGVELLINDNPEECLLIASELDSANGERQALERSILEDVIDRIESAGGVQERCSIVLASPEWHQGVIGIVASRVAERFHRPTILIALLEDGMGKGSGRSIPGFHLLEAIGTCAPFLERFGGHRFAAGIGLRAENVAAFAEAFEFESSNRLSRDDLVPKLIIDAEVQPVEVTKELADSLKLLEPFGMGNPEPVFMLRGLTVVERRCVGDGHLRLRLGKDGFVFSAIAFNLAEHNTDGKIDVAFFPEVNVWNGTSNLQLRIKDIRPSE